MYNIYKFEIISLAPHHSADHFKCGETEFHRAVDLHLQSLVEAVRKPSLTETDVYVLVKPDDNRIYGFYSIGIRPYGYDATPVINLLWHGVDLTVQKQGCGRLLMEHAITNSKFLAQINNVVAVVLEAGTNDTIDYFKQFGFKSQTDEPRYMRITIDELMSISNL